MRFSQQLLDEIRARIPVSAVVGRRVQLKKKGREFAGLSPFKVEKTPSFFVNDQKGFYHCFASGEHGDIFTFLMKVEGLSFPEAVEQLAGEAGVSLPKAAPRDPQVEQRELRLYEVLEAAAAYFERALAQPAAGHARAYIDQRGLSAETCRTFRIGYAPADRTGMLTAFQTAGFTLEELAASGMVIAGADIRQPYDRFRDRIMFPITDAKGRVIAFGGRALSADQPAKYLNSPETPLFHKGRVLFNGGPARKAAFDSGRAIVVEGYMDVIALHQAGFHDAVAPLGTALTPDQVTLLWRMADEPILCFDGDSAGRKAAHRAIETALPALQPGKSLRFAFLPDGLDPDDLIKQAGPGAMAAQLRDALSFADVLWDREYQGGTWDTPERRAALERRLFGLVAAIEDPGVRALYQRDIRDRLYRTWRAAGRFQGGSSPGNRSRAGAAQPAKFSVLKQAAGTQTQAGTPAVADILILRILLDHPWLIDEYAEEIAELPIEDQRLRDFRNAVLSLQAREIPLDSQELRTHLSASRWKTCLDLIDRAQSHRVDGFAGPDAPREAVEDGWRRMLMRHHAPHQLQGELDQALRDFEASGSAEDEARIIEIKRLMTSLETAEASHTQA
ncbi:MAG: DNA primase [Pseudomonadota bacterium]